MRYDLLIVVVVVGGVLAAAMFLGFWGIAVALTVLFAVVVSVVLSMIGAGR